MPLWLLFVAAQLVDILWAVLVLAGVERAALDYSLPSNPLVAEHMPYTHSLLGTALIATLAGLVVRRWRGSRRDATITALVVLSHWFLDLPMHRPDLTLAGFEPKLGLQSSRARTLRCCKRSVRSSPSKGTDGDVFLQLTRVTGQSLARVAEAQVASSSELTALLQGDVPEEAKIVLIANRMGVLVPHLEPLLGYVWRRHLLAG